jgi:endonuclease I
LKTRGTLGLFLWFLLSTVAYAQIPAGYYDLAAGKSGDVLRAALRDITTAGHVKIPYTSSSFDIWDAYAVTDVRLAPNNTIVWDMYSDIPNGSPAYTYTIYTSQCGSAPSEGSCYSREHCMPNSWWGGIDNAANPQYSDLHHLFPADQFVNNKKSNYIVAATSAPIWTSTNGSKLGPCTVPGYTGTVFEPINEYKGDFARAYLYLAARYMDQLSTWVTTYPNYDSKYIINATGGNYKQWYIDMLIAWNNSDPVSQKEIDRNNNIYYHTPQHNRNPFIDHPEYVCLVWNCTSSPVITNSVNIPSFPTYADAVAVTANVTDNGSVASVNLQWCTDGVSFDHQVAMNVSAAPKYEAVSLIPAQPSGTAVSYRIVAVDNEGNPTTSVISGYTVVKNEPGSYPALFTCGTTTAASISLTWTDAATPVVPDGYLIKASAVSIDAIADPTDGMAEANGTFVKNVVQGTQSVTFTGLTSSATYYFKIYPYTNSSSAINYKTSPTAPFTICVTVAGGTGSCAADLLISEYIEGSSSNKYIEISNNTGATVDLSDYKLQLFSNGALIASSTVTLTGMLADNSVIDYKNTSAIAYGGIAITNSAVNFNGDDAVALFKISTGSYVDIFGRIGEDPGTAWSSGSFTTLDRTLVRNASVISGVTINPASGFPTLASEWTQFATDDVTHLGSHSITCPSCTSPLIQAGNIAFSAVSQTSFSINWTKGDGANRLVVMSQGSPVAEIPANGTTYVADPVFGLGDELGADEYVVYNNSGSSVTISNLVAGQTYYVSVFEYNCSAGSETYLTPAVTSGQITSDTLPVDAGTISGPVLVCQGQNSVTYTVPAIEYATSYIWTLPEGATGTSLTNSISVSFGASAVSGDITVKGDNSSGKGSASTLAVVVNATPESPVAGLVTQPGCLLATGSVVLNNLPAGTWTINPGAISGSAESTTITGLTTNTYYYTLTNVSGCTSAPSVAVVIDAQPTTPPTPAITLTGNILHSDAASGNQWYSKNGLIDNATARDFTVTADDDYYVIVTLNGCSSEPSETINVVYTGLEPGNTLATLRVFPNPVTNDFMMELKGNTQTTRYSIMNSVGSVILEGNFVESTRVNTSGFGPGMYIVRIENGKAAEYKKIVKLN